MKIFTGKVISTKMAKTATVMIERTIAHPVYKKMHKKIKKYHVHDEFGVKVGDTVDFVTTKPISKLKKFKIIKIAGDSGKKNTDLKKKPKVKKVKTGVRK